MEEDVKKTDKDTSACTADEEIKELGNSAITPPKKKKYGWIGYLLLCAAIGLSIWMMLEIVVVDAKDYKPLWEIIADSDWRFALISLAVLIAVCLCIWLEYVTVLKITTGKCHFRIGLKVAFLGKFYDNVTPFSTGGQPMQIYYLHKKGFSGGVSSAVVFIKYIFWMISWLVVSLLLMACNTGVLDMIENSAWRTLITVCAWVGIGVNMLLPLMVLLFVIMPKFSRKIATLVVCAGYKIKVVKDKKKALGKAEKAVADFRSAFAIVSKRPLLFISLIILCVTEICLNFSLPYFIMRMFSGLTDGGAAVLFAVTALNTYVTFGVALIPTPGNTGAMEGMGALAFSAFVGGSVQFWSMFTWRFAIYYIYIIIGIGLLAFEFIRRIVRARRRAVKEKQAENEDSSGS